MKKDRTKNIETLTHDEAKRKNLPSAEYESLMRREEAAPPRVVYPRGGAGLEAEKAARDPDLDPQIVWRGKDRQDRSDLVVSAPPLYIQEKIKPKVLIDDLRRQTEADRKAQSPQMDMFTDFNGLPSEAARTEFYRHDANWSNRMILGDSLQVMTSLAEREGLRGKVQCIYLDPPYGIRFNSNFQWSTTSRDVKDGKREHITREPEQVKAFRDTWRDGIHSYLSYLRDRLIVARDLLTESGSIFVQIGDENVHRVRMLMDEVFGEGNFVSQIAYRTTTGKASAILDSTHDFVLWYSKSIVDARFRRLMFKRNSEQDDNYRYDFDEAGIFKSASERIFRIARMNPITSQSGGDTTTFEYNLAGYCFRPKKGGWKTNRMGMERLEKAQRLTFSGKTLGFIRPFTDFGFQSYADIWDDTRQSGFGDPKYYVVQTASRVIQRCLLMATDPGDLVLDPTCGSGTTATVAEQWGRRWITIDTSRVALALARMRIMGARYPYYLLADSQAGKLKEAERSRAKVSNSPGYGDIRQGFVYERVPHITLKSIANNTEIDTIWETYQPTVLATLEALNGALRGHGQPFTVTTGGRAGETLRFDAPAGESFRMPSGESVPASELLEWEVPREMPDGWPRTAERPLKNFWEARLARQREMDRSIAARADFEYLYDKPFENKSIVRVAGPFTVESLSPHRMLGVDENGETMDGVAEPGVGYGQGWDFAQVILDNLKTAGVQQAHKEDKITFTSLTGWPGDLICIKGKYREGEGNEDEKTGPERRAGVFIGPEFGTVSRADLAAAAREAMEADFHVLIACAFNYDAHSSEFNKLGPIPVLRARMNADLHMADDLKNTGQGNLFVIFGEPDMDILAAGDGQIRVKVNGVDVFHPQTGEVRADGPAGIACWFIDTDYNEESFFCRQAYFLGANDPYKSLKTTLKAEIDESAWATLYGDTSRPFPKPESGRIAVKVINHLGDEVMRVFRVD